MDGNQVESSLLWEHLRHHQHHHYASIDKFFPDDLSLTNMTLRKLLDCVALIQFEEETLGGERVLS